MATQQTHGGKRRSRSYKRSMKKGGKRSNKGSRKTRRQRKKGGSSPLSTKSN